MTNGAQPEPIRQESNPELALEQVTSAQADRVRYPQAPRDDALVQELHGTFVPDPFRPLENPQSPETQAWLDQQEALWNAYKSQMPQSAAILSRLEQLIDFPRSGNLQQVGGKFFSYENSGLQVFDIFMVRDTLTSEPKTVLDPSSLSADGTISIRDICVSPDAKYAAYLTSDSGSDWLEIRVRSVQDGVDLGDRLQHAKFTSISWDRDTQGFYYSRYDAAEQATLLQAENTHHKLYYHKLGTPQEQDALVCEVPDRPRCLLGGEVSFDNKYLIVNYFEGSANKNRIAVIDRQSGAYAPVFMQEDARYSYLGNRGETFYFMTTKDAPNEKIISFSLSDPSPDKWRTIIPENDDRIVEAQIRGEHLVISKLHNVHSTVQIYSLADGALIHDVALPGLGSIGAISGEQDSLQGYFEFTSFQSPPSTYVLNVDTGTLNLVRATRAPLGDIAIETEQVWFKSKDGTAVPMFLVHRSGITLDGSHPTILYGYGGFDISRTPAYASSIRAFVEAGGIWAQPTLRGGGEFGQAWHEAAMKEKKQNTFDDCIAAAEYLIEHSYTSAAHLGINGGSNGGLLVGACITQRPELFGAAVPQVGVLDMLRFHKFTIGHAWRSEYGDPEKAADFKYLYAYSPLHNIREGVQYPATLVMTSDHDDRVVPAHSFKFAARLQEAQSGSNPILMRVERAAGHGAGRPLMKELEEAADKIGFFLWRLS